MKTCMKRLLAVCAVLSLLCSGSMKAAAAQTVLDLNRKGSVSVTMQDIQTKKPVPGGSLTLYQAAEIKETDGNYSFVYTGAFVGCELSLEDVQSEKLARGLAAYIKNRQSQENDTDSSQELFGEITKEIGNTGTVSFSDLKTGLYLLIQETAAEGYSAVSPFLVTVPFYDSNAWSYDVDASPKVSVGRITPSAVPSATPLPGTSSGKLPQTGQLWWPVPLLAAAGTVLFMTGWFRRRSGFHGQE